MIGELCSDYPLSVNLVELHLVCSDEFIFFLVTILLTVITRNFVAKSFKLIHLGHRHLCAAKQRKKTDFDEIP